MSWLSKQLKSAKKMVTHPGDWVQGAGKTVGKGLQQAAPLTAGILAATGVGAPLAAGLMAAQQGMGSVLQGKNAASSLKAAGMGAAAGALPGVLSGIGKVGGAALGKVMPGAVQSALPGAAAAAGAGGAAGAAGGVASVAAPSGIAGILKSAGGSVLKSALKNPELLMAGVGAVQNARDSSRANALRNEALGMAKDDYASRAPIRAEALKKLMALQSPERPDLSATFVDAGNPYSQSRTAPTGIAGAARARL